MWLLPTLSLSSLPLAAVAGDPSPRLQLHVYCQLHTAVPAGWAAGHAELTPELFMLLTCRQEQRWGLNSAEVLQSNTAQASCAPCPMPSAKCMSWDFSRKHFW